MPQKKREFITGEIYHLVNRRIGEETLFKDIDDHYRGIFCIYEFNTTKSTRIREQRAARLRLKKAIREASRGQTPVKDIKVVKVPETLIVKDERDLLVEVLAFCLMPNHIHLLVRQLKDGGISSFMQKFGSGFASYFKSKYQIKIKGHFFQDRFFATHIETDEQLKTVFVYLHTNSIALIEPDWKEKGIKNPERVIKFLEDEYRWSSFFDYIGKKNFPSVTSRDFLLDIMGGEKGCKKAVEDWIKYKGENFTGV